MKKYLLFLFLLINILNFSTSIEDIKNLSKMPNTLNQAWVQFVKYISENPNDPSIGILGEILSAKKYFYENYKNAPFLNSLIQENFNKFCNSLGLYNGNLNEEETQLILKIFPKIPLSIKRTLETGIIELNSYKYFYKLDGLNKYISPFTYQGFLQIFVDKSIKSPVFLDKDMEKFVVTFVPKSKIAEINNILNNSTYFLDENNYLGAFKLLDFLRREGIINTEELQTYSLLKKYFDLKAQIGELSSNIYIVELNSLENFTQNILNITEQTLNLNIEKNTLYTLLTGILKTIRIRIESSNKIIFKKPPDNIDKLIEDSQEPLKTELIELKQTILNSVINKKDTSTVASKSNIATKTEKNEKNNGLVIYYAIILILFLIFIFLIPYFILSHKSVEFYMKLKLYKIALKITEKMIIKDPNDYKTYILMARILEELDEVEQAMMAYKMAHKKKQSQQN
ncbi:hypothetical protein SAMN02745164_00827 [Marinitoga hydrogenitolerans DSM 16785]|uniref:Tetratricopeptide repeat-containing protein n=1 Tax=Marinitoga hydrogenitolerans (strain DSM 16785 / JCM 12826 / AT1271) TaxID=1122195 RepID=A0A1M4V2G1_MARH1|nr:hypothetical protein [Marinitoga hydrogenitolerans]SHE63181.1 hypothetical protein SAMN02745164_00827 [Marinitoga hydrogenitolerans DSM 16785]